jgi:hypothetical protein
MRPATRKLLDALVTTTRRTGWRIMEDALLKYRDMLPPKLREPVDAEIEGVTLPASRKSVAVDVPAEYADTVNGLIRLFERPKDRSDEILREFIIKFLETETKLKEGNGN